MTTAVVLPDPLDALNDPNPPAAIPEPPEPVEPDEVPPAGVTPPPDGKETDTHDARGVPWKNVAAERGRKLSKLKKDHEDVVQSVGVLREEVTTLRGRVQSPPAPASTVAPPASVTPSGRALDMGAIQGRPVNEWPDEYLHELKRQAQGSNDPKYATVPDYVDGVLEQRRTARITANVTQQVALQNEHKTLDTLLKTKYPTLTDPNSALRKECMTVMREWGLSADNLRNSPKLRQDLIERAAANIGLKPEARRPMTNFSGAPEDIDAPGSRDARPEPDDTDLPTLSSEEREAAGRLGVTDEKRLRQEHAAARREPRLAPEDTGRRAR